MILWPIEFSSCAEFFPVLLRYSHIVFVGGVDDDAIFWGQCCKSVDNLVLH